MPGDQGREDPLPRHHRARRGLRRRRASRRARSRDGDEYVINGSKTYITNGHRADVIVLVTKTDPDAGYDGFTLFLVPMDAPGVIREKKLEKLGMHASDTALLAFQDVRVPDTAVLGQVGKGFYHIMWELQGERLIGAAGCVAGAQQCFEQHPPVRQGAQGLRPRDRPLPGHPPQVRRDGDEDRVGAPDGLHDRLALQQRRVPGARDLDGQAARRARRGRGRRRVHPDPRRRGLHEGVRRRARVARHAPEPHRRRHRRDHARRDRPLATGRLQQPPGHRRVDRHRSRDRAAAARRFDVFAACAARRTARRRRRPEQRDRACARRHRDERRVRSPRWRVATVLAALVNNAGTASAASSARVDTRRRRSRSTGRSSP